ncbi:MAG: retron St85 family RNA-directed DNA polymerase [Chloroflexi bacterium]|nr:retron St85 family RNA-directed DNA polymerase [Chloroflexota bacterium]
MNTKTDEDRLKILGLPIITNIDELADLLRLSKDLLYKLSKFNQGFYNIFPIPKKNGGSRIIFCPSKEMKAVQSWILRNILYKIPISNAATGFREGRNILYNAERHKGNKYFLCLDIEDFFPSISYPRVHSIFTKLGYNSLISTIFARFCTCKGILPQGGVTSPAISNIICNHLDKRISGYVGKHNVTYTRYADDITFSALSYKSLLRIKKFVTAIICEEGFTLNESKTRFAGPRRQRKVTGLIIYENCVGIGKKKKKKLRAALYKLANSENLPLNEVEELEKHINGWLSFINGVDKTRYNQLKQYASKLHLLR